MRPRKKDTILPICMYLKHGSFWYVKGGKWTNLGRDLPKALTEYDSLASAKGAGMVVLIDNVLSHISKNLKPNTISQYRIAANRLKRIFMDFSPEQVKPKDVAAIKVRFSNTPAMANRMLSFLRVVFQYAVEWQLVDSNPCVGIKRHVEKKRGRYITDEEYVRVRSVASPTLVALMDILYLTGQRIGDVLAIRLADIADGGIDFRQQKTDKRLTVKMTSELRAAVERARALPRGVRGLTLFCSRNGTKYAYGTVRDMLDRATQKAGVEDFHLHDLRAKALTDAKRQGKDAQKLAGHTDGKMTARYIRQYEIDVAEPPSFRHFLDVLDKNKSN